MKDTTIPAGSDFLPKTEARVPQKDPEDRKGSKGKDMAPCVHHAQGGFASIRQIGGGALNRPYSAVRGPAPARRADGNLQQVRRGGARRNPEA